MLHTRSEVVARAAREFDLLDSLIARLPSAAWDLTSPRRAGEDAWTVKDALAHITARKHDFIASIAGPPMSRGDLTVHAFNHLTFEEWHARPAAELVAWHRTVQRELIAALSAAPEPWFARDTQPPWPAAVDRHSVLHRTRDIERPLKDRAKQR